MSLSSPSHEMSSQLPNAMSRVDGLNTLIVGENDKSNTFATINENPTFNKTEETQTKASSVYFNKVRPQTQDGLNARQRRQYPMRDFYVPGSTRQGARSKKFSDLQNSGAYSIERSPDTQVPVSSTPAV
mmetsp:Transcript_17648/g.22304  ORF Transcript_17648/g.22304 Transcript_17648/m.22304 type:complete len:129 (+) Transcript_17648:896-1282(+)